MGPAKPRYTFALKDPIGWLEFLSAVILFLKDRREFNQKHNRKLHKHCVESMRNRLQNPRNTTELYWVRYVHIYLTHELDIRMSHMALACYGMRLGQVEYIKSKNLIRLKGWLFALMQDELTDLFDQMKQPVEFRSMIGIDKTTPDEDEGDDQ